MFQHCTNLRKFMIRGCSITGCSPFVFEQYYCTELLRRLMNLFELMVGIGTTVLEYHCVWLASCCSCIIIISS